MEKGKGSSIRARDNNDIDIDERYSSDVELCVPR
jgi:hypothetical protein